MNEWVGGLMDRCIDEWMDWWMDEFMSELIGCRMN